VSTGHVVSVRRTGQGAVCLMSDGRQVPVSRRRRADVLARFGDGVRYVGARSEAVTNADLD
jgi:DNA-binding LytR/AlgR family response regulator